MCPAQSKARRQLSFDDRLAIEVGLDRGDRLATIARTIGRDQSVVAREIRANFTTHPTSTSSIITNRNICKHFNGCDRTRVCGAACTIPCWRCSRHNCNDVCQDFEAEPCERHDKTPFVCNGCPMRSTRACKHPYRFYEAKYAHELAKSRRSYSRAGIDITPEELERAVEVIRKGLKKRQSPAHIVAANRDSIPFSASTLYRYVDGDITAFTKLDLPRAVRYKPRKKRGNRAERSIPRAMLKGRTYDDFLQLSPEEQMSAVEIDTVVGRLGVDRKVVLTLYFRRYKFQLCMR